jgi:hypothetical protein
MLQGSPKIIRVTSASYNKFDDTQHIIQIIPIYFTWIL